ncbi:MATE family efflux transporter [Hydrogenoanaerobacterium saccharovorans]|uniref:MATE family efflux transporter n=1 Tax=Hydrogenoanaerobacterium saccharovorans TaxID=474960 RepID=A0ABS2GR93_9FIRM|nr:MATE family efflux transporter [Hydrogenoanaerobacterium saccharovorans]MBM6924184.1 MATE family efflux transporter [Hydrogenoanaerobacterium saccharovorans]
MSVSLREENKMAVRPVFPLLMSMAIPPMISMLIQSLYNIVDSMFVAKIGEDALTAVSLAFPVQTLIVACSVGIGVGVNSYISRSLGREDQEGADSAVAHGLLMAAFVAVLFIIAGQFLLEPFFRLFSDDPAILADAITYTNICLIFCAGSFIHICIEKVFQSTGSMIFPMLLQALGAITNIILDPIMIFGLFGFPAMGVKGAAVATVIGQHTAMLASLLVFLLGKFAVRLDLRNFHFRWKMIRDIASIGIPNSCMNALGSVLVMGLNTILIGFSNTAVSLFGIYYKLQTFVFMPASGLTQGAMPIMGFSYGAGNGKRLQHTLSISLRVCFVIMAVGCVLFMAAPEWLLGLFDASEEMLAIGVPALRIISVSFLPAAIGFILPTMFQAMGQGGYSLIVFLLRQLVITLPAAAILSGPFGLTGIWASFILAESIAAGAALLFYNKLRKKDPVLG